MKLSVVVTTKNRKSDLLECVNSVLRSSNLPKEWELIIIDDNSRDGTELLNSSDFGSDHVAVIHNKKTEMMVKSRNIGARRSKGEYILFIDDDNIIDKNMIHLLLEAANKNPDFGLFGPSMYYYSTRTKYLDYQKIDLFTGKTNGLIDKTKKNIVESDGIPNVFMVRSNVFKEYGYFDEDLVQTFTEPDFSFKISQFGIKAGIYKKAITYHKIKAEDGLTPRSLGGQFKQKSYCLMRNRSVIIARYGNSLQKITYMFFFSWFWPLTYSLILLPTKRFDLINLYWRGFVDGWRYYLTGTFAPFPTIKD